MEESNNENTETKSTVTKKSQGKIQKTVEFFKDNFLKLQISGFNLFLTVVIGLIIMFLTASFVFFSTVRGEEQVMVPNVVGKQLTTALLELQVKELFPKIQLRYTNDPADEGKILTQTPEAGSIVNAGRRINLTVSEGAIANEIEDYTGQNFKDVKDKLDEMYKRSSRPLVSLSEPSYKTDNSSAGTILAQTPEAGTKVSRPTAVRLIVSSGPDQTTADVPDLTGKDVAAILSELRNARIVFDFTKRVVAAEDENVGKVIKQDIVEGPVKNYTRIACDFAVNSTQTEENIVDLFVAKLAEYPLPVSMKLESIKSDGSTATIVTLNHTGGNVTIPFVAPKGSELALSVAGKVVARQKVD